MNPSKTEPEKVTHIYIVGLIQQLPELPITFIVSLPLISRPFQTSILSRHLFKRHLKK